MPMVMGFMLMDAFINKFIHMLERPLGQEPCSGHDEDEEEDHLNEESGPPPPPGCHQITSAITASRMSTKMRMNRNLMADP